MHLISISLTFTALCFLIPVLRCDGSKENLALSHLGYRLCASPDSPIRCKDVDILLDSPKESEVFRPRQIQIILLLVIIFSNVCAIGALFFHWWNTFVVLFYVYRRLMLLEKKMITCQERMAIRGFSEQLIGKLAHMANFDFTANQNEVNVMLKSMMQ